MSSQILLLLCTGTVLPTKGVLYTKSIVRIRWSLHPIPVGFAICCTVHRRGVSKKGAMEHSLWGYHSKLCTCPTSFGFIFKVCEYANLWNCFEVRFAPYCVRGITFQGEFVFCVLLVLRVDQSPKLHCLSSNHSNVDEMTTLSAWTSLCQRPSDWVLYILRTTIDIPPPHVFRRLFTSHFNIAPRIIIMSYRHAHTSWGKLQYDVFRLYGVIQCCVWTVLPARITGLTVSWIDLSLQRAVRETASYTLGCPV